MPRRLRQGVVDDRTVPGVGHTRPWAGRERGIWAVAQEFVNISMEHRPRTGATPVHCCAAQVCSLAHPYTVANRAVNWQIPSWQIGTCPRYRAHDIRSVELCFGGGFARAT